MDEEREIHTITKNAAKVVEKKRWLCVGHVVVEDVLDGADVGEHNAIILRERIRMRMRMRMRVRMRIKDYGH